MTIYFIEAKNKDNVERYLLDATEKMSISYAGRVSKFPVEEGSELGDHYSLQQPVITYNGGISDIKMPPVNDQAKTTLDYLQGILKLREEKIPIKVYFSEDMPPIENCYIEQFSFSQDKTNGVFRAPFNSVYSYKVNMVIRAIEYVSGITKTIRRANEIINPTDEEESSFDSASSYKDPDREPLNFNKKGEEILKMRDSLFSTNPGGILP